MNQTALATMIAVIVLTPLKTPAGLHMPGTDTERCELPQDEYELQLSLGNVRPVEDGDTFTPADPQEGVTTVDANPDPTDDDAFVDPSEGQDSQAEEAAHAGANETEAASPAAVEADERAASGESQASRETGGDAPAQQSTPASTTTTRATKRASKRAG